ncbi:MAG: phospholipase C, phosphocholine-specific [Aquabacterium sp.]|nr:phospholipase C, phosphocholine-specific [Aquabacterium sp.]
MSSTDRRRFLRSVLQTAGAATALNALPPAIQRALAIPANRRTGTIEDVEHIVVLTQENRSFDHYFGALNGVRGFADPFPIPVPSTPVVWNKSVWTQPNQWVVTQPASVMPFHLNTEQNFEYMRVEGTPHSWADAQLAWDHGRMNNWTFVKGNHAMGYFKEEDIPFQYALANAFTICDAYHCATQTGTNTNRLFIFTGTNDPKGMGNGPATYNDYDSFDANPGNDGGYTWPTYPESLQAAGISWQVYENMDDNFTDNPLAGFHAFRDAWFERPGYSQALRDRGVTTRDLDKLKEDVLSNKLPQVSWVVATAEGSEHPGPSSPAQGADYIAKVLDALTANPEVWSKTVLIINFDENDGFFDHMPPPAPPSYTWWDADSSKARLAGASTVDARDEYHHIIKPYHNQLTESLFKHRPYGLGPRVPLYVVSPWSKGGWVNSQVFDHTSVIRFIEKRFGVPSPNVSAWRRAVSGDLSTAFNFADPDDTAFFGNLPQTEALAERTRALGGRTTPTVPVNTALPSQPRGARPSRALPYLLTVQAEVLPLTTQVQLSFGNVGQAAAVFHVYDRNNLLAMPRRYTVEPGKSLQDKWGPTVIGIYDVWVLGPNGFHRHVKGNSWTVATTQTMPEVRVSEDPARGELVLTLKNGGLLPCTFQVRRNRYDEATVGEFKVGGRSQKVLRFDLQAWGNWYDYSVRVRGQADYLRRFAGRMEDGQPSITDPAMHGEARIER